MRMLEEAVLRDSYDVVVIGAGIGGITAGALLASRGLSVLVVEQHYLPGGVCSTVRRRGVSMDAGAALLFGFSSGSDSPHRFVMNTLGEDIDVIPHEALYRMHFQNGKSVTFWRDFERYFGELTAAFPGRDEQFRGYYEEMFGIYRAMSATPMPMSPDTMPRALGLKMLLRHPLRTLRMLRTMDASLKSVLDKYVRDAEVEGFFDLLIASCYCTKSSETPLMLGAAVVCNTHGAEGGACYPAGSPQMLPNTLERGLEKHGGQVLYRHRVERILFEGRRACGVRLDGGAEIAADHVVSDADVYQLYGRLIPRELVSPERRALVAALVPSVSAVVIYLSVDAAAIPPGTFHIEAVIDDLKVVERNNLFAYIPSIDDPSVAPEGVHSMAVLCSMGDWDWPRPDDPRYRGAEYQRRKQEIADKALDRLEATLFPKLREHIRHMEIGTPSTIERFTLKHRGSIGGPKQMLGQHLMLRLKARTEFERLYAVGDSTVMGEGVVSVTASAVGAANRVLEDRRMEPFLPRRFPRERIHHVRGRPRAPLPPPGQPLTEATAMRLAAECQWCEHPKCIETCPAGVDVPGFVRRIESGNFAGAARTIRERNPFGELCGVACPAERLCESQCTRREYSDGPVRIGELQAWVCRRAGRAGWVNGTPRFQERRVAVVGGGPAGLTCAWFLARLGTAVEVLVGGASVGGVPATMVPEHRVPRDVAEREVAALLATPRLHVKEGRRYGADLSLAELEEEFDAVFLAPGLGSGRRLAIPGIAPERTLDAVGVLTRHREGRRGVLAGRVVVVGGGSVAADVAGVARREGAQVTLVCLEQRGAMPCLPREAEELERDGVDLLCGWGPAEGRDGQLVLEACTSTLDGAGRFRPAFDETRRRAVGFDLVVLAVGQQPDPALAAQLERDLGSAIVRVDAKTQRIEGRTRAYAGGDLVRGAGTIVEAVADGRRAAMAIQAGRRSQ
jgi:phytoene dehydrogenase-like protein